MNVLRRLFGSKEAASDGAIHLYVTCNRCGSPVHVRVDPRNDLTSDYDESDQPSGYRLTKEIMDSRCFRLMRADISYDRSRRELSRELEGGTFISKEEYDQLAAPEAAARKA